ncbi:hypothetical protein KGF56_003348 [Candida oxycetoniae]|uniref:Biogenesis of lysosome-related organelles complex 1 subunit CNL1 n=1 Tax=Candida oxycetoniae TaxID=497107 RepID=A0AAI9SVN2_9ASCO|nr:uncharacterized protein KGF56_003348 [Candida oxycetoniae]KAI3403918.1 hypothetical protein KGF56_003348 [Candida oxycetoniae]
MADKADSSSRDMPEGETHHNVDVAASLNESSTLSQDEPDPLELRKLSLSYDYMMYKIKDYIKTLMDQTYESVLQKQTLINQDYFENQLQLSRQYREIEQLIKSCNDLELEFMKIDQLEIFVKDFKQRLDLIEAKFSAD